MGLFDAIHPGGSGYGEPATSPLRALLSTRMLAQPKPPRSPADPYAASTPPPPVAPSPAEGPIFRPATGVGAFMPQGTLPVGHGVGPTADHAALQALLQRLGVQTGPPPAGQTPGAPLGHIPFAWRILRAMRIADGGGEAPQAGAPSAGPAMAPKPPKDNWTAGNMNRTGRLESEF